MAFFQLPVSKLFSTMVKCSCACKYVYSVTYDPCVDTWIRVSRHIARNQAFYPKRPYKIAPLLIDTNATIFSGGGIKDVTYRLKQSEETDFYVNSDSGVIFGTFGKPRSEPYTMQLIAVDKRGEAAVLEEYSFTVQEPPTFAVKSVAGGTVRKSLSGDDFASYSSTRQFYTGQVYKFAPLEIDNSTTTFSDGDASHVKYRLDQTDTDFFVNSDSGVIFGSFAKAKKNITMHLVAIDKGGEKSVLETFTFNVKRAGDLEVLEGWKFDAVYQSRVYVDTGQTSQTFAVGESYNLPPINISTFNITGAAAEEVTFTLKNQPPGFLVDTSNGFAQGIAIKPGGPFRTQLFAIHNGRQSEPLATYNITLRYKDTHNHTNGPQNKNCAGGDYEQKDAVLFDGKFTCDCGDTYSGGNCEFVRCGTELVKRAANTSLSTCITAQEAEGTDSGVAVGAVLGVFIVLLAAIAMLLQYKAYQKKYRAENFAMKLQRMVENGEILSTQINESNVPREIKRGSLKMIDKIGRGAFGEVWKALLDDTNPGSVFKNPEYLVAAKTVLDGSDMAARDDLLHEAVVMAQVKTHPHLVSLIGVITRGDPLVLIVSFAEHGSLLSILTTRSAAGEAFFPGEKMRFCKEIADGMHSLTSQNFVHRDLATRNVLMGSGMVCKIADFGLSRGVKTEDNEEDYYRCVGTGALSPWDVVTMHVCACVLVIMRLMAIVRCLARILKIQAPPTLHAFSLPETNHVPSFSTRAHCRTQE